MRPRSLFRPFPSVRVEPLPEVIREHRVPTPVTDELLAWFAGAEVLLPTGSQDAVRLVGIYLTVWDQLTERIAAGWPPDGLYAAGFYRDDRSPATPPRRPRREVLQLTIGMATVEFVELARAWP